MPHTKHLFIWNDWAFTTWRASSRSLSCSSPAVVWTKINHIHLRLSFLQFIPFIYIILSAAKKFIFTTSKRPQPTTKNLSSFVLSYKELTIFSVYQMHSCVNLYTLISIVRIWIYNMDNLIVITELRNWIETYATITYATVHTTETKI